MAPSPPPPGRLRRLVARTSLRLLAFNVLLVFVPAVGVLYLDTFEEQLLTAQERTMVQQGRVLAAALGSRAVVGPEEAAGGEGRTAELSGDEARALLAALEGGVTSRLRVLDREGRLLADSSQLGPRREEGEAVAGGEAGLRTNWLYRLGAGLYGLYARLRGLELGAGTGAEHYASDRLFDGPEVRAALAGRYGAATRLTPGQRSVTLYSALPVRAGGEVVGVVLVSHTTFRLLRDLYDVRLAVFQVFLVSVGVAVVLSLVVGGTIVRPLRRLRREAAELVDSQGRLTGSFGGSHRRDEIGDLARALEELSRRLAAHLQALEAFAADVSHELKNPLASIRSGAELLAEAPSEEEGRRYIGMILGEVARLERLLGEVREITVLDARLGEEGREEADLGELLGNVVSACRLREGGKAVELALPAQPISVRASPDRLVRVFENLLANALGFAPAGSEVEVALHQEGGQAVVTVADRGPGIPPENLPRLFDRFFTYRPGEAEARRWHSGLGLAIVKAVVEGHGGSVEARNRDGGGAIFSVRLPAA